MRAIRWGTTSTNALAPIIHWKTADVFAYLAKYDLPIHPAYACLGGGRWPREKIRVAEIGDTHGGFHGRYEWEMEYYPDESRHVRKGNS
jgi:phosphoadenosine phosphosulfate reductase